jgi:DNA-binding winged helix-turn-helix (wHTH) protein
MNYALSARVRFGEFELDLKAGELHRGGQKIRLQEQPFQILHMLVERAGELVTREEIQSKLLRPGPGCAGFRSGQYRLCYVRLPGTRLP